MTIPPCRLHRFMETNTFKVDLNDTLRGDELRKFMIAGIVLMPIIKIKELYKAYFGITKIIIKANLFQLDCKEGIKRQEEEETNNAILYLNIKLKEAIENCGWHFKSEEFFVIDKNRLDEIKIVELTEEERKDWTTIFKNK